MNLQKQDILDHFYEYTAEDDWLSGIEIYKGNGVRQVQSFPNGLIQAKIHGTNTAETRIRINQEGQCIQWVECNCRKYRTTGIHCEHIAAFAIFLDREHPDLIKSLNNSMPIKPKGNSKTLSKMQKTKPSSSEGHNKLLFHSLNHIHSIGLIRKGPNLRVKAEIKRGELSSFDLNIDEAGELLKNNNFSQEILKNHSVQFLPHEAVIGGLLESIDDDNVRFTKILVIPHGTKKSALSSAADAMVIKKFKPQGLDSPELQAENFIVIPLKKTMKNLGKGFVFIPGAGYLAMNRYPISDSWWSLPLESLVSGDDLVSMIQEQYARFAGAFLLVDPKLGDISIVDDAAWQKVQLKNVKHDWFDLDPIYGTKNHKITMAEMIKTFRETNRRYIRKGKVLLKIPELVTEFNWDLDESGELVKTNPIQFFRLSAALGGLDQIAGSKELLSRLTKKVNFSKEGEVPSLSHTNLNLRTYQEDGLRWFWWLYRNNLAGLLADEMGLGKTHQAMACLSGIQLEKKNFRFLVVCPTSVLDHWRQKTLDFAPGLNPVLFHGAGRQYGANDEKFQGKTIITSYGIVLRDIESLAKVHWDAIILDEAHYIKNNKTATYHAISRLSSPARLCLTGTPIENNLNELKNIFDFLLPGYLGSDEYFREKYMNKIGAQTDGSTELSLQKLIHPFKLRRTKKQVAMDLPDKIEDFLYCNLAPEQADLYRNILNLKASPLLSQIRDEKAAIPTLHVFAVLNLLKQICDHPALVLDDPAAMQKTSGKFEAFKELLAQCLDAGGKIVIFSQYLKMIDIISYHLKDLGVEHSILTGSTRNRGQVIQEFQENPNCRVFIGSLLAGGIGIDLTAASTVIHYDRWWNASKENQATDRVHRIGQVNTVQVFKMITRGTLEEKINHLIARKQALFDKFIEKDEELFKSLTREDLIELLT